MMHYICVLLASQPHGNALQTLMLAPGIFTHLTRQAAHDHAHPSSLHAHPYRETAVDCKQGWVATTKTSHTARLYTGRVQPLGALRLHRAPKGSSKTCTDQPSMPLDKGGLVPGCRQCEVGDLHYFTNISKACQA